MITYIYSSNYNFSNGVTTWENLVNKKFGYQIINSLENTINSCNVYVNNCTNESFYKYMDNSINFYYVMHSDLCPVNDFLIQNIDKFKGIVCTSKHVYNKCKKYFADKDIIEIYNDDLCDVNKENIKNVRTFIQIHYIGRLAEEKNLPMLFDAIRNIENIKLCIYGTAISEEYEKYLRNIANKSNIYFMGYLNNECEELYDCDIVILPSIHEGLPFCLLEAHKRNIQIISNNFSKLDEHIQSNGYFLYDGLNYGDYENILTIKNYNVLLKKIGYIDFVVTHRLSKQVYDKIKDLITKNNKIMYGVRILIPETYIGIRGLYEKNVCILRNKILELIK